MPDIHKTLSVGFVARVLAGLLIRRQVCGFGNPSSGQERTEH